MKSHWKLYSFLLLPFGLAGCELFNPQPRYQLAAGGSGGPAAVFKMNAQTGELWYAWWDPTEQKYRWRRVEKDERAEKDESETINQKP